MNTILPSDITRAIREETALWLETGRVKTVREIGDGLCYTFCESVFARLGLSAEYSSETGPVEVHQTEDWWARVIEADGSPSPYEAEDFMADIPRLRSEGAPVPDDVDDAALAYLIGSATHEWIGFEGRHYDATAPEGVEHWLLMPFFADQITGYRAERDSQAAA